MIRSIAVLSTLAACLSLYTMPGARATGTHGLPIRPSNWMSGGPSSLRSDSSSSSAHPRLAREYSGPSLARWTYYRSPDGRFTARFPTTPVRKSQDVSGRVMKIVESTTESAAYMLMYMDFGMTLSRDARQRALSGAAHGVAGQGRLVSITPTTYQGYSAREVILEKDVAGHPAVCNDLIFIAHNCLYQVMTVIPRGTDDPANTRVFQRGFKLSEN